MSQFAVHAIIEADSLGEAWEVLGNTPVTLQPDIRWVEFRHFEIAEVLPNGTTGASVRYTRGDQS